MREPIEQEEQEMETEMKWQYRLVLCLFAALLLLVAGYL